MAILTFGAPDGLRVDLEWTGPAAGLSAEVTRGYLSIQLGGRPVWGEEGGALEWTWIELLEFMAHAWPYLLIEQSHPSPLNPATSLALEDEFDRAAGEHFAANEDELREQVFEFLETHDLARGLQGIVVDPLRLLRRGNLMEVSTRVHTAWLPRDQILTTLTSVCDAIASRVGACSDERSTIAIDAWHRRLEGVTPELLVEVASGLPRDLAVVVEQALAQESLLGNGADYDNEILAAARMSGRFLQKGALRSLLDRVRSLEHRRCDRLDELSRAAEEAVPETGRDYEQGYALGSWARHAIIDAPVAGIVDVEAILRDLGVALIEFDLDTPAIDAVAVFGPRHGPAVLLNTSGQHAQGRKGRRATLAHELCHLLRDRTAALPFAEALSDDAPPGPERRARAFAAELLLPQAAAVSASTNAGPSTRRDWEQLIEGLSCDYEASTAIVAWQLKNGHRRLGEPLPRHVVGWLESVARRSPAMHSS